MSTHTQEIPCGSIEYDNYDLKGRLKPNTENRFPFRSRQGTLVPEVTDRSLQFMFTGTSLFHRLLRGRQYLLGSGVGSSQPGDIFYRIEGINEESGVRLNGDLWWKIQVGSIHPAMQGIFESDESHEQEVKHRRAIQDKWYQRGLQEAHLMVSTIESRFDELCSSFPQVLTESGLIVTENDYQQIDRYHSYHSPFLIKLKDGTVITIKRFEKYPLEFNVDKLVAPPIITEMRKSMREVGRVISLAYWKTYQLGRV